MCAGVRALTVCARCFPSTGKLQEMIVANTSNKRYTETKEKYILLGEDWTEKEFV